MGQQCCCGLPLLLKGAKVTEASRSPANLHGRWSAKSIPRKAGHENFLGAGRWIYRLVCQENVEEVYDLEESIGVGGFATVYIAQHKEMGYRKAVKKIPKAISTVENEDTIREIYVLMDLDHPHIMKLSRMYDDGKHLYIVSELCKGLSLADRIKEGPMSEYESGLALRHILKAVLCCHSHYIGHYDIKPENFVYAEADCSSLKMIDLGLSRTFQHASDELRGTLTYTAPEIWNGVYGPEADIWSCGVILFVMATRSQFCTTSDGFLGEDQVHAFVQDRRRVRKKLDDASRQGVSEDCLSLLRHILHTDRHMRITAAEALDHPYIAKTYNSTFHSFIAFGRTPQELEAAILVMRSMVLQFTSFGAEPVLVRAVLLVMTHIAAYITKETQAHRLAYAMLDTKGVGEISVESIEKMMPVHGVEIPANLAKAFKGVDHDGDGYLTYGDFLAATLPRSLRCREDLIKRVFSLMDRNHDGKIGINDLADTFLTAAERKDPAYVKQCRDALTEVTGRTLDKEPGLDFDKFFKMLLGGRAVIAGSQKGFAELLVLPNSPILTASSDVEGKDLKRGVTLSSMNASYRTGESFSFAMSDAAHN